MSRLLVLHSSARTEGSVSRTMTAALVAHWQARHPGAEVIERDLARAPLPHIDEATIQAFFTPAEQRNGAQRERVALSDALVDELLEADTVIIGAPMYNFSLPTTLKAWIDHVCRVGRTFRYTDNGPEGLLPAGKRVYVVSARGGVYSEGPARAMDYHETYLRAVLGFIGLTDVQFLHNEGLGSGDAAVDRATAATRTRIEALRFA